MASEQLTRVKQQLLGYTTKVRSLPVRVRKIQFPSISQAIPEAIAIPSFITTRIFLVNFLSGFILFGMLVVGSDLRQSLRTLAKIEGIREARVAELGKWQAYMQTHSDYADGFLKLASLAQSLGRIKDASSYVQKAVAIDPDLRVIRE